MTDDHFLGMQLDEYRLETLLGRGGMARVYRAVDVRLQRYAAIKVIDVPLQTDMEYTKRFEREAQAIAKLEHPNIVRLYRYGEALGVLYMAMQYIEGTDLALVLRSYHNDREFIEPEEAVRIVCEVCLALDYAHTKGIIHRDVKPSNIMLDKQGKAYLTDFGLALLTEVGTRGEIFGSSHYIAPEQAISSAGVVPQSDLYSVGIILYEMFTGQCPFDAETAMDIAMMHLSEPPPPPRTLRPEITPQLEDVILKAIEKDPERRYPNGAALVNALEQALAVSHAAVLAPADTTLSRRSIPERIAVDVAANPLPPIPAEVATPRAAPTRSRPVSAPPPPVTVPAAARRLRAPLYAGVAIGVILGVVALAIVLMLLGGDDEDDTAGVSEATDTSSVMAASYLTETAMVSAAETQIVAWSSTATNMLIPTATDTFIPAATLTYTHPPSVTSTFTQAPTVTPFPTLTLAPTLTPVLPAETTIVPGAVQSDYTILIISRGEDSLFVVNQGTTSFPLTPLQLEGDRGAVSGSEWEIEALQPGQCVAVWKDGGNPRAPNVDCELVGTRLTRGGPDRFWKSQFEVFYGQQAEFTCRPGRCPITIPG